MGAGLNLQLYWQQATIYLALIVFALLALNWVIISTLDDPVRKAKLRQIALKDALLFAGIPPGFYLLAPYAGDIMAALGTAATQFRDFVSLIHISIASGLTCYLIVVGMICAWKSPEDEMN